MTAPTNLAQAIRAVSLIEADWENWAKTEPKDEAPQETQEAWQADYDAFGTAHEQASCIVRGTPCATVADAAVKLAFLVREMDGTTEPWRWQALNQVANDLDVICERPRHQRIDDAELEMALADLEVARTFKDAADNFVEEVQKWLRPGGFAANKPLLMELHKAETLLSEMIIRIESAEKRVERVIKDCAE